MEGYDEEDNPVEYRPETYYSDYRQDAVLEAVSEHTLESENHSDSLGREDPETNRKRLLELLELKQPDHIVPKQVNVKLVDLLQKKGFNIETYLQQYYSQQVSNQETGEKDQPPKQKNSTESGKKEYRLEGEPFEFTDDKPEQKSPENKENKWMPRDSIKEVKKSRQESDKRSGIRESYTREDDANEIKLRQEMDEFDRHLQSLQAAEEELLNSYSELERFHRMKQQQRTEVRARDIPPDTHLRENRRHSKPEIKGSNQDSPAQKAPLRISSDKKEHVSVNFSEKEGSTPRSQKREAKTPTSSLARMYLKQSKSKMQESESAATPSSGKHSLQPNTEEYKAASSINTFQNKETPTPKVQGAVSEPHDRATQMKKAHEMALARRPDRQIKSPQSSKKPLTLKEFREMATQKTQNQSSKTPKGRDATQSLKNAKISTSLNPYNTPKAGPSHYAWESLAYSAKMRDEKVFAMTPSQEYLILDRQQLIANPQIKVLNSKDWTEFLGVVASEEEEELGLQPRPNFTIADDTVYRKNMNWLAEKKKALQEKKEKLEKAELDQCTFWPNLKRGEDGELYYSPPSRFLGNRHESSEYGSHFHSRSVRSNQNPSRSRSGSRDRGSFSSYSELHEYRKNLHTETEKKFNFMGIINTRFLTQKSPGKLKSPSSEKLFSPFSNA